MTGAVFEHTGAIAKDGYDEHEIATQEKSEYVISWKAVKDPVDSAGSAFVLELEMDPPAKITGPGAAEFVATGKKVKLGVFEGRGRPGHYELAVRAKEVLPPLLKPSRQWLENQVVRKGETRKYRIPTEKGKTYLVHVQGGSVSIRIGGRPQAGNMSRTFTGTGEEVPLEMTGSGTCKVWCSLKTK